MEALGQRNAALPFSQKSLDIYQELKKQDKSSFEADARMEEAAKEFKSVTASPASEMQD
jgi:hypothetical protein